MCYSCKKGDYAYKSNKKDVLDYSEAACQLNTATLRPRIKLFRSSRRIVFTTNILLLF